MRHYCSLSDSKYLPQLLCLYDSLKKHSSEEFTLHVLPMDDLALRELQELRGLSNICIREMGYFEKTMGLAQAKRNRSWAEYCWTCASNMTEFIFLMEPAISECTYLDADLFFMGDPRPAFDEIGDKSIAITPHRLPSNSQKARLQKSGLYNVGFVHFKNADAGRACLSKWAANVRNRCSAEVGCGDQCYLDDFERDFPGEVCILSHGINAGPWNLMAYEVSERDGSVFLNDEKLICFHMHEYIHGTRLTNYPLRQIDKELIYKPYVAAIEAAKQRIEAVKVSA